MAADAGVVAEAGAAGPGEEAEPRVSTEADSAAEAGATRVGEDAKARASTEVDSEAEAGEGAAAEANSVALAGAEGEEAGATYCNR